MSFSSSATVVEERAGDPMQKLEAIADCNVLDAKGKPAYRLRAGARHVLTDQEAGFGLRDGAVRLITSLDRTVPCYHGQALGRDRLILFFIGRQGDAIVAGSCLATLRQRYPDITIDITSTNAAREVFTLLPRFGELFAYPLEAERVHGYDYYLSFEEIEAVAEGSRRSCGDVFSACLHTPRPTAPARVTVPPEARARWRLPTSDRPRVGVHRGRSDSLRAYPHDLTELLIRRLTASGFEVYRIGLSDAAMATEQPAHPGVHDLIGQTESPADLAAVISQLDALVTADSFPMHLAGAMGVPTLTIFTATDPSIASDYASVTALRSAADCSPCRVADGRCPLGHHECIAHRDSSVAPEAIVRRIESTLGADATVQTR